MEPLEINFRALTSPLVYIVYVGEVCEYVGLSSHGLARVLSPSHHAVSNLIHGNIPLVRLFIIPCQSRFQAEKLEREKIKELQPRRNGKQWKGSKKSCSYSERHSFKFDSTSCRLIDPEEVESNHKLVSMLSLRS
jgi:hypothetical protein